MQVLATRSHEFGISPGLDLIKGEILPFPQNPSLYRVPHMGWNSLDFVTQDLLFSKIETGLDFYFAHSYFFLCQDKSNILATTFHGEIFVSALKKENVY
jgi:glutamine amidotransferase